MFKGVSWLAAGGTIFIITLAAFQMPWRLYPSIEPYDDIRLPPDHQVKAEWVFARLMYPQNPLSPYPITLGIKLIWRGQKRLRE